MSMNGEYLRLTPAELKRALADAEWALELAEEAQDAQDEVDGGEGRWFSTGQTWNLLAFLLRRVEFPVDLVFGEETLTEEDWGYGKPRYLTPERVRLAADALGRTSYDRLVHGVDPAELTAAEVYPLIWDEPAALDWARDDFGSLVEYVRGAAADGDALVLWID
ncbi:YfbM family protein [Streptomyces sp. NPDC014779]|uniref:YfbM family protein n=1 Tax=unclassified Streptomyces TaxID=2593676 RepID=UPI0036F96737